MQIVHATFAAGEGKEAVKVIKRLGVEVEDYKLIQSKTGDLLILNLMQDKTDIIIDRLKNKFNFSTDVENSLIIFSPDTVIPRDKEKLKQETFKATRETIVTYARENSEINGKLIFLAVTASIVTSLGLIINNTPVIVGSMIIAPVFGPIAAAAIGIVLGDFKLLGRGLLTELVVILIAVLTGVVFGFLMPNVAINHALKVRMFPTVPDLLIAMAAGGAGAYALITNTKSRQLIGVVIAAALIPVMATIGIGIALWNITLIKGAALLLFGNFFSLLLMIILVFYYKGLKPQWWYASTAKRLIKRSLILLSISVLLLSLPFSVITYQQMVLEEPEDIVREVYRSEFEDELETRLFSVDIDEERKRAAIVFYTPGDTDKEYFEALSEQIRNRLGSEYEIVLEVLPTEIIRQKHPELED